MKSWLWVALCTAAIYLTVPLARTLQELVYNTLGKEFFTYAVFFIVCAVLTAVLYFLFFKYRVRSGAQYIWLLLCAGIYIYYTAALSEHPEEAMHFVEYGVLAYLLFRALSARIHDWTIYITALFLVAFIGAVDEFIQWMVPGRYWDYKDVGINASGGGILLFAIWRGIRPGIIARPVGRFSRKILVRVLAANLVLFSLCLANTPEMVKRYTSVFEGLAWLRDEEPMTEYRFLMEDPETEDNGSTVE